MADDEEFDFDAFEKEIENWAKGASHEAHCAFASQCAARVLPNIGGAPRPVALTGFSFDVIVIRAMFTSAVAGTLPTADVKAAAADSTAISTNSVAFAAAFPAANAGNSAFSAADAASSAASSASSAARSATDAASSAAYSDAVSTSSAARSAVSSARSAAELLNQSAPKVLLEKPLWLNVTWPDAIANNWKTLRHEWSTDPAMAFWIDWYEGLLKGRTPDWDLWYDIVLIDDEHWKAGPEAVAREIERIKKELRAKRAEKFEDHVRSMVPRSKVLAPQADRLANLIEEALNLYHREISNCTADSIEPLEKLPNILRQIRFQLTSDAPEGKRVKELALLVHAMVDTIDQLNRRLERASALPTDQRSPSPSRIAKVVTHPLFNTVLGAVLATGLTTFAGAAGDDINKEFIDQTEDGLCLTDFPKDPAPVKTPAETSDIPPEAFTRV
ncbi:hypothetical protein [Pacificibacter sp.]|uniref:hypothetical protein n=1 Tax=Pacificibacter sp. TaxID=1917866 RepID=UPI00321B86E6